MKILQTMGFNLNLKKTEVIIFNKHRNAIKNLSFVIEEKNFKLQANILILVLHLYH